MRRRRFIYAVGQWSIRVFATIFYGYRVEGLEHVPVAGACLIAANHKSYLDPPVLGAGLPREIRYFAKKELFAVPLLGPLIRVYGAIPVDRSGSDRAAIQQALSLLRRGEGLLVFPEGTRIRRPGLADPKEGIALLAHHSRAPVVPARIESTWEPRRRLLRRIPIRIRFGAPLRFSPDDSDGPPRGRYGSFARQVMKSIARLGEDPPARAE